jgi:hypothetical protein
MPTVEDAAAVTVTVPLTVAPAAGAVIDTVGGCVAGGFVVWDTSPAQPKFSNAQRTVDSQSMDTTNGFFATIIRFAFIFQISQSRSSNLTRPGFTFASSTAIRASRPILVG